MGYPLKSLRTDPDCTNATAAMLVDRAPGLGDSELPATERKQVRRNQAAQALRRLGFGCHVVIEGVSRRDQPREGASFAPVPSGGREQPGVCERPVSDPRHLHILPDAAPEDPPRSALMALP
jgi:hypothetical protein